MQKGVVAGKNIERQFTDSKIYPGTQRTYWIYIPAGYKAEKPACLYVCMDGIQFNATTVFENEPAAASCQPLAAIPLQTVSPV
ncbi:MAG: hypothetical protein WCP85_21200 [Mariniphaga sp.]